jgi:hypothetical protein
MRTTIRIVESIALSPSELQPPNPAKETKFHERPSSRLLLNWWSGPIDNEQQSQKMEQDC